MTPPGRQPETPLPAPWMWVVFALIVCGVIVSYLVQPVKGQPFAYQQPLWDQMFPYPILPQNRVYGPPTPVANVVLFGDGYRLKVRWEQSGHVWVGDVRAIHDCGLVPPPLPGPQ